MLAQAVATGVGVFAQHGPEIKWFLALATGFGIVVWRVSAVATLVRIQNGRVEKLEKTAVLQSTFKALKEDVQYIRGRVDAMAGDPGG